MTRPSWCFAILAWLCVAPAPAQTTITVGQGAGHDYATIQAAIDAATTGDTVVVSPESYVENIHFAGKNITLRSNDPTSPPVVAATVIDGNSTGPVVTFSGTETSGCVLSGFTIRNGLGDLGGGVSGAGTRAEIAYCFFTQNRATRGGAIHGCDGVIRNNVIEKNRADLYGGGLFDCDGTIAENVIRENSVYATVWISIGPIFPPPPPRPATDHGGGGLADCNATIENNRVVGNWVHLAIFYYYSLAGVEKQKPEPRYPIGGGNGGGLYRCNGTIRNNVIAGNSVWGAGGGLRECNGLLHNNTIVGNTARYYVYLTMTSLGSGGGLFRCEGEILNCIISGNDAPTGSQFGDCTTPTYSCIDSWTSGGLGNISDDPLFLDADGADDNPNTLIDNDYRLAPASPCVDTGHPDALYDDACRPPGLGAARNDMGAYGGPGNCRGVAHMTAIATSPTAFSLEAIEGARPTSVEFEVWNQGLGTLQYDIATTAPWLTGLWPPSGQAEVDRSLHRVTFDFAGLTSGTHDSAITIAANAYNSPVFIPVHLTVYPPPRTITVGPGDGYDYATIQEAIDAAADHDTVLVHPGRYVENIRFRGKNIILQSTRPTDPATVAATIIDGNRAGPVVTFAGTETSSGVLSGFTITNGQTDFHPGSNRGGGIRGNGAHVVIEYNTITGNIAGSFYGAIGAGAYDCDGPIRDNRIVANAVIGGGGVGGGLAYCDGPIDGNLIEGNSVPLGAWNGGSGGGLARCMGRISNNRILDNVARNGGGIYGCPGTIHNNIITSNAAVSYGGGIHSAEGPVLNNIVTGNSAAYGGGLYFCRSGVIQNNTIVGNRAEYYGGGLHNCDSEILNCIVWRNAATSSPAQLDDCSTPAYSCVQGWTGGGVGNIDADPWFVDCDGRDNDPTTFDDNVYYLSLSSPCIDAGHPAPEYNDAALPPGLGTDRNDMGAYGGPNNATWPALPTACRRNWPLYR